MNYTANLEQSEIEKFSALSSRWWDLKGPMAPLHILNPCRLNYIKNNTKLESQNVLDVGCGAGILTESLAMNRANITGLDASSDLIEIAKEHSKVNDLEIEYVNSTIEEFVQSTDKKFDVIACMELLEHVPDPASLIKACSIALKPGGKLFISTLNRTIKSYLLAIFGAEYVLDILPKGTHEYKKFIKPAEIDEIFRESKISLKNIKGLDFNPFTKSASLTHKVDVNYILYGEKQE